MSDTCITYYTEFTQNDPPVRKQNQYNALTTNSSTRPCDTWICNDTSANEYDCLGIKYETDTNGNVTVGTRYMTIDEWKDVWKKQKCVALFESMTQGYGTTNNSSFSQLGFQYVQEDFAFMLLEKPGCYVFIGNGDGEHRMHGHGLGPCNLHNPSYDFNDDLLPIGATYWVRLAERFLSSPPLR